MPKIMRKLTVDQARAQAIMGSKPYCVVMPRAERTLHAAITGTHIAGVEVSKTLSRTM